MVRADVPEPTRRLLLGHYVSDELADGLDRHYVYDAAGRYEEAMQRRTGGRRSARGDGARVRRRAQRIGAFALVPFVALLIVARASTPTCRCFWHRSPAFLAALPGIARHSEDARARAARGAAGYAEYYFLFPLFLSITLLTSAGFFDVCSADRARASRRSGRRTSRSRSSSGSTFLSAILDNNIVADFASRGLHGLDISVLHFFAMAQIAGYALGGCWTHIGCAQSVVAYAFIQRDVDEHYTPVQWIAR